jgi:hypothetical protein
MGEQWWRRSRWWCNPLALGLVDAAVPLPDRTSTTSAISPATGVCPANPTPLARLAGTPLAWVMQQEGIGRSWRYAFVLPQPP